MLDVRMIHTLLGLLLLSVLFSGSVRARYPFGPPRAILTPIRYEIPIGGSVTLSCFVDVSGNWTISWYNGASYGLKLELMKENEGKKAINVSQGGIYYCQGKRDSGASSYQSDQAIIEEILPIEATVTLQPNWTQIYMGESFTVRCDILESEGTYWSYRWRPERFSTYYTTNEKKIMRARWSDGGEYQCRGSRGLFFTQWSNIITITLSFKSRPVLTVSPSWLSPRTSVTLNCEAEHPPEGWTFSWYKALPYNDLSQSYTYELLPNGSMTAQAFYVIKGQTRTAVYVCRAERRSTQFDSDYSNPNFVWSADLCSSASLTVSPHTGHEFNYDFVTLTCEGNSTAWRVRKFPEDDQPYCNNWWRSGESICKIYTIYSDDGVYWCESLSGEFSNAVNITLQDYYSGPILLSPVDPVNEGTFVSIRCKLRRKKILPNVVFYHNDKLVQNDTREELNILAVSKSDEGFYKCLYSGKESPSRWVSVKPALGPESSSSRVSARMKVMTTVVFILVMLLSMDQ